MPSWYMEQRECQYSLHAIPGISLQDLVQCLLEAIDTRMILYGFGIGFPISFPGTPMVFDVLMCAINPFWEPAKCVYKFFGV